jgi:hypothetical protein
MTMSLICAILPRAMEALAPVKRQTVEKRRWRARSAAGHRCFLTELHAERDAQRLVLLGYLNPAEIKDRDAIRGAVQQMVNDVLDGEVRLVPVVQR